RERAVNPGDVSFWYLTNNPGRRFLRSARQRFGDLEQLGPGLWRSHVMERLGYLVSNTAVPVEDGALPVHLGAAGSNEDQRRVVRVAVSRPRLWQMYGLFVATTLPNLVMEMATMAQRKPKGPQFDIRYVAKEIGMASTLQQAVDAMGVDALIAALKEPSK